jgi:hypothetical protein
MVLFRALGWVLLAVAVAAGVNDCLVWWSEGVFRLLSLRELWSRLDLGSLQSFQDTIFNHVSSRLWQYVLVPILMLWAAPALLVGGAILLWLGRRTGSRAESRSVMGTRPRRRRRRGSIS